jgi:site-specific DNA recombinase
MAAEMKRYYGEQIKARQAKETELPRELRELTARIERLHARLRQGDPDMDGDELQAAIDKAEGKRRELEAHQPEAKSSARIFAAIPRAAALYRAQVCAGLDGNPREALKAKALLRRLFVDGKVTLSPTPTEACGPITPSRLPCFSRQRAG